MTYRIVVFTDDGRREGYWHGRLYPFRWLAVRRARILARSYRYRTFHVEPTREPREGDHSNV